MNRLIQRYPMSAAYFAAVTWITFVVTVTGTVR
jgi:hypothetical protein